LPANSRLELLCTRYTQSALKSKKDELEKVAINYVLPIKAARRDAIANWKFLGPRDTNDLISMVPFAFAMRRHLIPLGP